jgi:putative tricarboxylic transport membrane protein
VVVETILAGIADALTWAILFHVIIGVTIGIVVGAIPGLSSPMALAIAVPITYYMSPLAAIAFLVSVNKGATIGGAFGAILLNTPGTPDSAATALDGYPMAQKGKPQKALKIALYSSVTGDFCSDIVLFVGAAFLAGLALQYMQSPETVGIIFLSMTVIAGLVGKNIIKGYLAAAFGFFLSTIGTDTETGMPRLIFGNPNLLDGVPLIAMGIGLLAMAEVFLQMENRNNTANAAINIGRHQAREDRVVTLREYLALLPTILRSAGIGTAVGALPGIGSTIAAFLSYSITRNRSDNPEDFGSGKMEGIAATEAANSSVVGANLIPLLALGIPGNVSAALLVGAFIIHGAAPGPLIMQEQGQLIYGLFTAMVMATICNLIIGSIGLRIFAKLLHVPSEYVYPVVILLCMTGAYVSSGGMFGIGVAMIFAVIGYLMRKMDVSYITFIIGFILGNTFESSLQQTIILATDNPGFWLEHKLALFLYAVSLFVLWRFTFPRKKEKSGVNGQVA